MTTKGRRNVSCADPETGAPTAGHGTGQGGRVRRAGGSGTAHFS
jgi:hypothetical protein